MGEKQSAVQISYFLASLFWVLGISVLVLCIYKPRFGYRFTVNMTFIPYIASKRGKVLIFISRYGVSYCKLQRGRFLYELDAITMLEDWFDFFE